MAVVAAGDLSEEAVGGRGLPRDVGRWVRVAGPLVLGVSTRADCVEEVFSALLRDLGEVPLALGVALGRAVAQLVRAHQAVRGGDPHFEPIVEVLKPGRQQVLRGLVVPRPCPFAVHVT